MKRWEKRRSHPRRTDGHGFTRMASCRSRSICLTHGRGLGLSVNFLQAPDTNRVAAAGSDGFHGRSGAADGRDTRDAMRHRVAAYGFLVGEGMRAGGAGVDDEVERSGF